METFSLPRKLVHNAGFLEQKQRHLKQLKDSMIDAPIRELVRDLNALPYCFTLQCCYGHFVYDGQSDKENMDPLPTQPPPGMIEWRIAYIALCVENIAPGRRLLQALEKIPEMAPECIQFCSAQWFWERQVNSYALQVEPDRFKNQDTAMVDFSEALAIEKTRKVFFERLHDVVRTL